MLNLEHEARFDPARADEFLDALPPRPAVLLIEPRADLTGARSLLLRTADLRRRLKLLLGPRDPASKRVNLREYASGVRYRVTGSAFEQSLVQWQHARRLWPRAYRQRLRLHPPAVVKLTLASAYPRAYVTRRVGRDAVDASLQRGSQPPRTGLFFGPFASRRAADAFLTPLLDLFRIRRCQIKIRRDPAFPGCIYSEMKMCLAPCFAGCTDEQYAQEVARVSGFLMTRGASFSGELSRERESASLGLDFERASALHRLLEKVESVRHAIPEVARPIEKLDAVILQRSADPNAVAAFVVRGSRIADPFLLSFAEFKSEPRSVEQILRNILEPARSSPDQPALPAAAGPPSASAAEMEDYLALLARWFYARPREGEIFFAESGSGWPYRRLLRACSRLLAPPAKPQN